MAINETLPVIESPVCDGLPVAQTALAKTSRNLLAASYRYADTDQQLGKPLAAKEFATSQRATPQPVASTLRATSPDDQPVSAAHEEPLAAAAQDKVPTPDVPTDAVVPQIPGGATDMGQQFSQIMGTTQSFVQNMYQTVQGSAQNQPLTDEVLDEDKETDFDAEETRDEEFVDGAAPGVEAGEKVPTGVGVDSPGGQAMSARETDR